MKTDNAMFTNTKSPCGRCYFSDGTVEQIISYTHYSDADVVFSTESGRYQFRAWYEPVENEILYANASPTMLMAPRWGFYKFVYRHSYEHEVACQFVEIDKIEIE